MVALGRFRESLMAVMIADSNYIIPLWGNQADLRARRLLTKRRPGRRPTSKARRWAVSSARRHVWLI